MSVLPTIVFLVFFLLGALFTHSHWNFIEESAEEFINLISKNKWVSAIELLIKLVIELLMPLLAPLALLLLSREGIGFIVFIVWIMTFVFTAKIWLLIFAASKVALGSFIVGFLAVTSFKIWVDFLNKLFYKNS